MRVQNLVQNLIQNFVQNLVQVVGSCRDERMGEGHDAPPVPMFSNFPESWSKVSDAARDLATAFSLTVS